MRKPSADSWKYILRYLPASCKCVRLFAKWLEENKPLFWVNDAFRLSECVKNRKVKRISREDIPKTVQPELIAELIKYLQAINDWYNEQRRKEAKRQAKLGEEYLKIPFDEREKIEFINRVAPKGLWPLENCPEEVRLFERLKVIKFAKLSQVIEWLNMPKGERVSWLNETARLISIVKPKIDIEIEKVIKEAERKYEEWKSNFNHRHYTFVFDSKISTVSAYNILGLPVGAGKLEIKSAFRQLAKKYHPDAGGQQKDFVKIREAYEVLIKSS